MNPDSTAQSASLPLEPLDIPRLLQASRKSTANALGETKSGTAVEIGSGESSEDDWEKMEHSKLSRSPVTQDSPALDMLFTWFGQSTCLVQMENITLLTDPVFGNKPMDTILAPSRLRPPACSLQELLILDIVDIVLISHNHFDHLDVEVVRTLQDRVTWVVPLALKGFFLKAGVSENKVIEMDWWEERRIMVASGSITVACTPAQHWSGRTPWAANQTLWCGFIVKGTRTEKSFYHCGDTGYSQGKSPPQGVTMGDTG